MENVYGLMAYVAALAVLVGCVLLKVSDILEQKRDEKYYYMIKDDAAFWQMKVEQTVMNMTDDILEKSMEMSKKMTSQLFTEPEKADEEFRKEFEELDGLDDEIII